MKIHAVVFEFSVRTDGWMERFQQTFCKNTNGPKTNKITVYLLFHNTYLQSVNSRAVKLSETV